MQQVIFDTAELFFKKGIRHVVLSPGSRNAPLTISFARHPKLKVYSIVDERSAGFIALGIALKTREPVVICCTSGTALLNYAPAVAEAFYQQVPLIVMSADRPPEWIDQRDGQTINQTCAFSAFVKAFYQLPADLTHPDAQWEYNRKLNEAVNLARTGEKGPVHLNVPFREPFYPAPGHTAGYSEAIRVIEPVWSGPGKQDFAGLISQWHTYARKVIIVGQQEADKELEKILLKVRKNDSVVVITDVIANQHHPDFVKHHDFFLQGIDDELAGTLYPELVLTCGKSVVSKSLKLFIRKFRPRELWHFDEALHPADTYQSVTKVIQAPIADFLQKVIEHRPSAAGEFQKQLEANFCQNWKVLDNQTGRKLDQLLKHSVFCEFTAFRSVMQSLPEQTDLHLANSMPVRFANFIQGLKRQTRVFANRGTSGIDGTNGTAVGNAIAGNAPVVLLTGDLSFFYDRNSFFHHHDISRLKIVVFNNQGGGIFRLIKGPSSQPELETYFETRHQHSAKFTAVEYGIDYYKAEDMSQLEKGLTAIFKDEKAPKILEIFTEPLTNEEVYNWIKNKINNE